MNEILNNLNKNGAFYKFNGIVECVNANLITDEIIEKLRNLKKDNSQIAGHTISEFSIAALDIIGIEKYKGDDPSIIELIKSKFGF